MYSSWKKFACAILVIGLCLRPLSAEAETSPPITDPPTSGNETSACQLTLNGQNIVESKPSYKISKKIYLNTSTDEPLLDEEIKAVGIEKIYRYSTEPHGNGSKELSYISAQLKDGIFQLQVTKDFRKYYAEYEDKTTIIIDVILSCVEKKPWHLIGIMFEVNVDDANVNAPIFMDAPYEFNVPMPLPKNVDLIPFGKQIVAKDIDLTNSKIDFDLTAKNPLHEKLFSVKFAKRDNKVYYAELKSLVDINLNEDAEFILKATDNGKPPKTSETMIKIKVDHAASLPQFSSNVYVANCTKCIMLNKTISFDKPITLNRGYDENVNFTLEHDKEDIKNAFNLSDDKGIVTVSLIKKLPDNLKETVIFLKLVAQKPGASTSAILSVKLPERETVITSSSSGLLAATIILSLLLVGILIGLAYFYKKHSQVFNQSLFKL